AAPARPSHPHPSLLDPHSLAPRTASRCAQPCAAHSLCDAHSLAMRTALPTRPSGARLRTVPTLGRVPAMPPRLIHLTATAVMAAAALGLAGCGDDDTAGGDAALSVVATTPIVAD